MIKKRIAALICLLPTVAALLTLPAAAESAESPTGVGTEASTAAVTDAAQTDAADAFGPSVSPEEGEKRGVADILLGFLSDHTAEIFCILTFVCSCTVTVLFRRGLLPALSRALGALSQKLGDGVSEIERADRDLREATDGRLGMLSETGAALSARLEATAEGLSALSKRLADMESVLAGEGEERDKVALVLRAQLEMFYRFFSAVNLPHHEKERLGETYLRLCRLIGEDGEDGDEA